MESLFKRTYIERGFRETTVSGSDSTAVSNGTGNRQVKNLVSRREHEKKEMQELNDKFAVYLSRVRFLETQNRKLEEDLDELRSKWGFESGRVREHFDNDLSSLRRQIDDATRDKAIMELRLKSAAYDTDMLKHQIDFNSDTVNMDKQKLVSLHQLKEGLGTEMEILEHKYRDTVDDIARYRSELNRLLEQMEAIKSELDSESLSRVQLQNDLQTLEDQLAFMKAVHEDELSELKTLISPSIDTSQFYRAELAKAISDIRRDFEQLNKAQQTELEEYYKFKTEEIREQAAAAEERKQHEIRMLQENKSSIDGFPGDLNALRQTLTRTRDDISTSQRDRADLETRMRELTDMLESLRHARNREEEEREMESQRIRNEIVDKEQSLASTIEGNVSLRFEINTYRRLLESEEHRLSRSNSNDDWKTSVKAERISVHKSARGPICIDEIDPSGAFITLLNTSANRDIDLKGWCIRRKIDQRPETVYFLPSTTVLKAHSALRIFSRSHTPPVTGGNHRSSGSSSGDRNMSDPYLIADMIQSWSLGNSTTTKLIGDDGQEKAVYFQKIGG